VHQGKYVASGFIFITLSWLPSGEFNAKGVSHGTEQKNQAQSVETYTPILIFL
jgi:hypothetical protein